VCGRFVSRTGAAIERYFNITARQFRLFESYNVAPGIDTPLSGILMGNANWY
jgi:hypothetical protein